MKKSNIIGIAIALFIIVFALIAKSAGGEIAFAVILPILALLMALLCAVDIYTFSKSRSDGAAHTGALIRIISLAVMSVLLIAAFILNLVF